MARKSARELFEECPGSSPPALEQTRGSRSKTTHDVQPLRAQRFAKVFVSETGDRENLNDRSEKCSGKRLSRR